MRVKITAQFTDSDGDFTHADLSKPVYAEVRDHIAEQWAKNGWCICLPEVKAKKEPEPEPEPVKPELAVIETPEDNTEAENRETAVLKRARGRPRAAG